VFLCCSFMIGGDGRVYEGRGWGIIPDLPKRVNLFENVAFHLLFMLNNIGGKGNLASTKLF
jgi:hypothetical protein